jgi:hypothetical protein
MIRIFKVPDGNEQGVGASWIPAGKTSGGFYEAVIVDKNDPNTPILHNNSIESLKDKFASEQPMYKPGWSDRRVLANPKGSRPKPSAYLVGPYINYYLSQFDTAALVVTPQSLECGEESAFAARKYMLNKGEVRSILAIANPIEKQQVLEGLGCPLSAENYVFHVGDKVTMVRCEFKPFVGHDS